MAHYNTLGEVVYNEKLTHWRFRLKILRICPFYSYVNSNGPHHVYVLADEHGTKMEKTIYDIYGDRFRGLEKQEEKWLEIFIVEVGHAHSDFRAAKSKFTLTATSDMQVHITDPLNDRFYFEFKGIHEIPHMSYKETKFLIDTMGVVFKTQAHFDDPERSKMVFYIRENIESQIKCVATEKHVYAFREGFENRGGRGQVIVVLKMGGFATICISEVYAYVFRFNLPLPEVEEFRQSVNSSDPYVWKHGAIGPL